MAKRKHHFKGPEKTNNFCVLCGRSEKIAGFMLEGENGVHICADCIKYANDIIERYLSEIKSQTLQHQLPCPTPMEIKEYFDEYVIGQEEAKETLAVAIYNHFKRICHEGDMSLKDDTEIEKSNCILMASSGSGKTYLCKIAAKLFDVPIIIVDSTTFTQAGYVGEDVESILSRLYQEAGYNVEKAERGIVCLDEIDKLSRKSANPSVTRDVNGEGVQQAILKLLEGSVVNVPPGGGRKHPEQSMVQINTKNILFIGLGAFEGIEKKIADRLNTRAVGFNTDGKSTKINRNDMLRYVTHQDLKTFGMIPELLGRMPVLATLDTLGKEELVKILTEPKNAIIKQYTKLFKLDGIKLIFEPNVYDLIAEKAIELKLGARGLRTVTEAILKKAMFTLPNSKKKTFKVTVGYAKEQLNKSKKIKSQQTVIKAIA